MLSSHVAASFGNIKSCGDAVARCFATVADELFFWPAITALEPLSEPAVMALEGLIVAMAFMSGRGSVSVDAVPGRNPAITVLEPASGSDTTVLGPEKSNRQNVANFMIPMIS